ncbi:MAG: FAD binding domain-containing protein [Kouleothrix sp.]|nr:FAD binding domain-containing protein [Kouleothrix sp.]
MLWQHYYQPATLAEALTLLEQHAGAARIVSGGTDVMVELQRGVRPTTTLIDITKLRELKYVRQEGDVIALGGLATHNDVIASEACVRHALPLAQACWEVGAPQIRTRATIAGNLVTASPANDTIAPLLALDAELALISAAGERVVPLREFYPGFRKTAIRPDELLREIRFPALRADQRGLFVKLGLRRAQAISVIDMAIVLTFETRGLGLGTGGTSAQAPGPKPQAPIAEARITLGCLAPTIVRAPTAEAYLAGKQLTPEVCAEAGRLACQDVAPIDDVRGSAAYRLATLAGLLSDGLRRIAAGREREGWPERPVLLETPGRSNVPTFQRSNVAAPEVETIETTINGRPYTLAGDAPAKSLLDALREDAGLTGAKEGCAEGECGACTVWLGGQAVMACLTPAAQAHGARVTTIEGLARMQNDERKTLNESALASDITDAAAVEAEDSSALSVQRSALHPLQKAFIANAAVQCGFCIPGMLMAGAKLLDEQPSPDLGQAQVALSGNICRCTGYRKILDAVLAAAAEVKSSEF